MPTQYRDDATPVVQFNPQLEVSPFAVFRRLRDGRPPLLVDVRPPPRELTLAGAQPWHEDWLPPGDADVVFFDDDGTRALELARHWQATGQCNVKALFGGLELWRFSLDPEVVGQDTYLVRPETRKPPGA